MGILITLLMGILIFLSIGGFIYGSIIYVSWNILASIIGLASIDFKLAFVIGILVYLFK